MGTEKYIIDRHTFLRPDFKTTERTRRIVRGWVDELITARFHQRLIRRIVSCNVKVAGKQHGEVPSQLRNLLSDQFRALQARFLSDMIEVRVNREYLGI